MQSPKIPTKEETKKDYQEEFGYGSEDDEEDEEYEN
jgi:hypothetical protein|tara:strand:- start:253 stop:360 length:108 start_codon:yes stop_codon:yes gene_type:complete